MRYKVVFFPMYEETLVIESLQFDTLTNGVDYTHHYTLKTPRAASWSASSRLRELADHLDQLAP
jgi:hypothetical protein